MESQDLDKLFRDAMEHAQETPSSRVWEGIEQELKKEKKVIPFHKKYRAQISIAAMFLLFFGIGLSLYKIRSLLQLSRKKTFLMATLLLLMNT